MEKTMSEKFESESQKHITIIGGGLGGLYSAWKLRQNGFKVSLIERLPLVGGLAASIKHEGYNIDIGPHYMTLKRKSEITDEIINIVGKENVIELNDIQNSYKSFYQGKILNEFPTIYDAIFSSGIKSIINSGFGLISRSQSEITDDSISSEQYLKAAFGSYLYEIWCKPYLIQNFGNVDLPLDYVKSRFQPLKIIKIFKKLNKKNKKSILKKSNNSSKYVDCYFRNGTGTLVDELFKKNKEIGVNLILNSQILSIDHKNPKTITYMKNSETILHNSDLIIYATPPQVTEKWFTEKNETNSIDAFNAIMLFLFVDSKKLFDGWLLNIFDSRIPFFRISQQNYLSSEVSPKDKTLLSIEIRSSGKSKNDLWNVDDQTIVKTIKNNLKKIGLINDEKIDGYKIIKFPNLYPKFKKQNSQFENLQNQVESFSNEFILGTADLDTGRSVSVEKNQDELVPSGGGIYNTIFRSKKLIDRIISENHS